MRRLLGWGIGVALGALVSAPGVASARPTVVPSSEDRATTVPAGGTRSLTLTCPSTGVALNAAPVRLPRGVRVADSTPGEDARRWTVRFASVARRGRKASATIRCVRLELPRDVSDVTLRVSSTSRPDVRIRAGASAKVALRCPRGYMAVGQGVGASSRGVALTASVPDERGWHFRIENNGEAAATARARIRCLQRMAFGRRGGGRTGLRFDMKHVSFSHAVRAGKSRSFTGSCARERFSVGTGVAFDRRDDLALLRSFPFGARNGSWFFRNRGAPERVRSYLLCLSRTSRFR